MSEQPPADAGTTEAAPSLETVEAVVRRQLATALGGRRGMIEAAVPTLLFTVTWLTQRNLTLALFGIGIGWVFVRISASRGGDEDAQALAYFLPGILYNGVYGLVFAFTCVIGWPVVGFMVGSVTGDPTAWHQDKQVVRLCTRLTWLLALPCVLRVLVQGPIWLAAHAGRMEADTAVALLGVLKIGLGWPLQLAALGAMVWVLGRNQTPIETPSTPAP